MSAAQWWLIGTLGVCAYAIRFAGLLAGRRIERHPRAKIVLDDLPGCLVVALVASSLADAGPAAWIAAPIALGVAVWRANVVVVMMTGAIAFAGARWVLS